ncbi:MAG TPA: hypothetical protein PLW35_09880 [Verrucomicrobiota bacterium]|nr:hypothetical protein [Verrucomicrobiota bacterium]
MAAKTCQEIKHTLRRLYAEDPSPWLAGSSLFRRKTITLRTTNG